MKTSEPFNDQLLPLTDFDISRKSRGRVAQHDFDVVEYVHPQLTFGINSPRETFKNDDVHRRKPGSLHHLAFKAASCEEVDALYEQIKAIGAEIVEAPTYFQQHGEKYYALFFKDPGGIKFEIVFEEEKR